MKKMIAVTVLSLSMLSACGQGQMPAQLAAQNAVRSMSANPLARASATAKPTTNTVKNGSTALNQQSKGQVKPVAPLTAAQTELRRDLPTSDVMTIARIGLDSMDRARTYEDGYNVGRSTLDSLARQNSFIARLTQAATDPQMDYESAYKALQLGLTAIANNQQISIANACDLIGNMMNAAKSYEAGARMAYGTMAFIRQSASYSIQAVIDASVRSAQSARYWEDSFNILKNAYGQIRYMQ